MKLLLLISVLLLVGCSASEKPECNCGKAEYKSLDGTLSYDSNIPMNCETGQPYDNINMGGYFTQCLDK